MSALKDKYMSEVRGKLQEKFSYENPMMVPKLEKITINMGAAEAAKDKNALEDLVRELSQISGQKPVVTKARKSISNFKLREGYPVGLKVTLRAGRMYDFAERLFCLASPRIRDFRGFKRKCDGRGNYTLGLQDQQCFLEINLDDVKRSQGMDITFVTSAKSDEECFELLQGLGLPFAEEKSV